MNLIYLCESFNLPEVAHYWAQVVEINEYQKHRFSRLIIEKLFHTLADKKIAILGFAFKKDTNDTRETPAITICQDLLRDQACLSIYDPKVVEASIRSDLKEYNQERIQISKSVEETVQDAHAIVILTEWDCFKNLDYAKIFASMQKPAFLFDGRNLLDLKQMQKLGFEAYGIGK